VKVLMFTQKVDENDPILGFTIRWIEELSKRVEELIVIASYVGSFKLPSNVRVMSLGKERRRNKFLRILNIYKLALPFLIRKKVDVIFLHMIPHYAWMLAGLPNLMGIRIYLWFAHKSVSLPLKLAIPFVSAVFTSYSEGFRIKTSKKNIISQGIDVEHFKYENVNKKNNSERIILSVGRISPIKDYETLIKAAGLLRDKDFKDFKVTIVGDIGTPEQAGYKETLVGLVDKLRLREHIEFIGAVPYTKIAKYYSMCDVHVNLCPRGGLDKAVLEAMACGTLSFAANEGFRETMGNYADWLLFRHGDAEDLTRKIGALLELSAAEREGIGLYLREQVIQMHNLERLTDKLVALFQEVMRDRR